MKDKMIQKVLKFAAKTILVKRKPLVVAITGSVGKTTTKEAIVEVLSSRFRVRGNQKNYNTEIGVPLTIIGCQIDYNRNKFFQAWGFLYYWFQTLFFDDNYPEILVLEMGADKPGDIKYFCDFITVNVGVLTDIGMSHLENFKTRQNLATEKGHLLRNVAEKGMAVYNYDNKLVRDIGEKMSVNTISYGLEGESEMKATDIVNKIEVTKEKQKIDGVSFKLNYQGKVLPVRLKHCMGKGVIYSCLAAFSVGQYFGLNLIEMIEILKRFKSCSGRLNFIKSKSKSVIIDDSYNSAPASLGMALELVSNVKAKRKILILGDMLELGEEEKSSHKKVGQMVSDLRPDYFLAIGRRMELAVESYLKKSPEKENVMVFENSEEAVNLAADLVSAGDLVLVKGSRSMKMEKIVDALK